MRHVAHVLFETVAALTLIVLFAVVNLQHEVVLSAAGTLLLLVAVFGLVRVWR